MENAAALSSKASELNSIFTGTKFERFSERAAKMVTENPTRMLALGVGAGVAAGILLPVSRLFRLGIALYPVYAAYADRKK